MLKRSHFVSRSSQLELPMASLTQRRSSAISGSSSMVGTPQAIRAWLTWLRRDSPVSPSVWPGEEGPIETSATCGLKLSECFASFDPDSHSWKTCRDSYRDGTNTLKRFSRIWPRAGLMRDGKLYQRPKWELRTSATDCGLWPTPRAQERSQHNSQDKGVALNKAVKWPTPKGSPSGPDFARSAREGSGGDDLVTRVARFPTHQCKDWRSGKAASETMTKNSRPLNEVVVSKYPTPRCEDSQCAGGHRGKDDTLYGKICRPQSSKFPTPQASMVTAADQDQARFAGTDPRRPAYDQATPGSLNPDWVEWLMGWPIGWTSLKPIRELTWLSWDQDPAERDDPATIIPRVKKSKTPSTRVQRIKAIGNGQVPQCLFMAFARLIALTTIPGPLNSVEI